MSTISGKVDAASEPVADDEARDEATDDTDIRTLVPVAMILAIEEALDAEELRASVQRSRTSRAMAAHERP